MAPKRTHDGSGDPVVRKRPAARAWISFSQHDEENIDGIEDNSAQIASAGSEGMDDTTGITPQQRHALRKIEASGTLPSQIQVALNEARASTAPGHQKDLNRLTNCICPKSVYTSYSELARVDSALVSRFRELCRSRKVTVGGHGLSHTEVIGPGKLGSEEALKAGIARGDVVVKVVRGKNLYFMDFAEDADIMMETQGRRTTGTADYSALPSAEKAEMLDSLMTMANAEFGEGISGWVNFAIEDVPSSAVSKDDKPPASELAMNHLQEAFDGLSSKTRQLKKWPRKRNISHQALRRRCTPSQHKSSAWRTTARRLC